MRMNTYIADNFEAILTCNMRHSFRRFTFPLTSSTTQAQFQAWMSLLLTKFGLCTSVYSVSRYGAFGPKEEVLGRDSTMKALITVTALPVVDTTRENCAAHAARGSSFDAVLGRWSSRPKEQERLLSSLFDWKAKDPARELLFVAGGMRCSSHTLLRDDSWPGLVANGEKV